MNQKHALPRVARGEVYAPEDEAEEGGVGKKGKHSSHPRGERGQVEEERSRYRSESS